MLCNADAMFLRTSGVGRFHNAVSKLGLRQAFLANLGKGQTVMIMHHGVIGR
jgi:hypothetical protein